LNKKQTYLLTTASAVIGLTVGVGTAGYRYFKNEENREKFLTNPTVQKLRDNTNTLFEQVRNGQLKLSNSKNPVEQVVNETSLTTEEVTNTVSETPTANVQEDQLVKNETPAPQAQATPSAKSTQTQNSNKNNVKPSQEVPKNNTNKNVAKN
jgi:hypothetical protein